MSKLQKLEHIVSGILLAEEYKRKYLNPLWNEHDYMENTTTEKRLKDVEELEQTICLTWKMIEKKDEEPCPGCGEIHTHNQIECSAYLDCATDDAIEALGHLMEKDKKFAYIITKAAKEHQNRRLENDGNLRSLALLSILSRLNKR